MIGPRDRIHDISPFSWLIFRHQNPSAVITLAVVPHQTVATKILQLLHGSNVGGLDVVLEGLNLLLEVANGDLLVLNNQVDLELLDTETNGDKLGGTPDEAVQLDGTDLLLEGSHVGLIIYTMVRRASLEWKIEQHTPRLDIEGDNGLGNSLGLGLLLLLVLGQSLITDTGSLGILLLVVRTEQVDIVVLLGLLGGLGGVDGHLGDIRAVGSVGGSGITRESGEVALITGNVLVPSGSVRVLLGIRGARESLVGDDISLRGVEAETTVSKVVMRVLKKILCCCLCNSEVHRVLCCFVKQRVLIASETRTNYSHHRAESWKGKRNAGRWQVYIPNDVRSSGQPAVEH